MASPLPTTATSTIAYNGTIYTTSMPLSIGTLQSTVVLVVPSSAINAAPGAPTVQSAVELPNLELKASPIPWNGFLLGWYPPSQVHIQALPTSAAPSQPVASGNVANITTSPTLPSPPLSNGETSTAPQVSRSPTATNPTVVKSPGVTSGAAAGIAIGCLIAGGLIAGLVFWFCWRKRKAADIRDHEASRIALMPAHEKGFAANTVPLGSGSSAVSPVSAALPLPLEDKAITSEISKIANSIKNHVQSYYQNSRVSPGLIDVDDIHAIGGGQPISAGTLSTLLGNTATREIALRFCIAWAVCSRMQPGGDPKTSLLPLEVAGCVQSITPQKGGSPG